MNKRSGSAETGDPSALNRWRTTAPNYILGLLTAVSFFSYLDRMVIAILIEPIKQDLGLTDSQMGLISGFAFAILFATLGLPLARVADRRSRISLISICLLVWSLMTALTGLVRSFAELFIVRMAVGVGEAGAGPAAHSILGDLFPRERRAFAISIFQAGGIFGQYAGLAFAGIVAQSLGWRAALLTVGLLGVPLTLLIFLTAREPARHEHHAQASAESMWSTLKALLARPPVAHLVFAYALTAFGAVGLGQWLPAFFMRSHGLTLAEVGVLSGATGVLGASLGMIFGGFILTRLGRRDPRWELWWPAVVFALFPVFMLPSLLVSDVRVVLGLQLLAFFVSASGGGVALSALQSFAEAHRRATAVGLMMLASSLLGLGLAPVAVGALSDLLKPSLGAESLRYALIALTWMPALASVHFWLAARSSGRWRLS